MTIPYSKLEEIRQRARDRYKLGNRDTTPYDGYVPPFAPVSQDPNSSGYWVQAWMWVEESKP